jgi:hypothetical protein
MYPSDGLEEQPNMAVGRLFLMLSMMYDTYQKWNNKDTLGN